MVSLRPFLGQTDAFPSLTKLSIGSCAADMDAVAITLRDLAPLQHLDLSSTSVTSLPPMPRLTLLSRLRLGANHQLVDFAEAVRSLTALQDLSFYSRVPVSAALVDAIADVAVLRHVQCWAQWDLPGSDIALLGRLALIMQQRGGTLDA